MWIRSAYPWLARMPTSRPAGLNPSTSGPAAAPATLPPISRRDETVAVPKSGDVTEDATRAAKAGGWHESSYELKHGLEISESEWPDDVTVPGGLGDD